MRSGGEKSPPFLPGEHAMDDTCETVKIVTPITADNPTGYIVINKSDLNDSHKLYEPSKPPRQSRKD